MPFPTEHAARQTDPSQYDSFRRDNKPKGWPAGLAIIYGVKDGKSEIQSIRAKASLWTVPRFRAWLKKHGFKTAIEPATGKSMSSSEPIFYRTFPVDAKAVDAKGRTVRVIASTAAIDGHGEIVAQDWDLSRFEKNPAYLWNHNRFAEGESALPLGYCKDYGVADAGTDKARLEATLVHSEVNPMAQTVLGMFGEGTLRAVSVGFKPRDIRYERRDGREIAVLSNNLLLEISACPIGSNPEALAEQKSLEAQYIAERTGRSEPQKNMIPGGPAPSGATQGAEMSDLKETQAELDRVKAELATANTERATLNTQNERLAKERDAAVKRAEAAEQKLFAAEVDELVGKKITAAERDSFLELRRSNPELFTKMIEQRSDLHLLERVVGDEPVNAKDKADQADRAADKAKSQPGRATADAITQAAFGG